MTHFHCLVQLEEKAFLTPLHYFHLLIYCLCFPACFCSMLLNDGSWAKLSQIPARSPPGPQCQIKHLAGAPVPLDSRHKGIWRLTLGNWEDDGSFLHRFNNSRLNICICFLLSLSVSVCPPSPFAISLSSCFSISAAFSPSLSLSLSPPVLLSFNLYFPLAWSLCLFMKMYIQGFISFNAVPKVDPLHRRRL